MSNGNGKTTDDKARALLAAGRVRLTEGGASVTNDAGHVYRVDFDLGGNGPHCQCKGFEFTGWCKHLTAAYMMAKAQADRKPEDEPMTDEEEDRMRDAVLDAGLDYGDFTSAAYALAW